jgi:hypothetical protein
MGYNTVQIQLEVNGLQTFKLHANIREALLCVNQQPNKLEREDNVIRFILKNGNIEFKRTFEDIWSITISLEHISRMYNYLNTNVVKVVVINLYYGNQFQEMLSHTGGNSDQDKVSEIDFRQISNYVDRNLICSYCHQKRKYIDQENCEYCSNELDFSRFLYEHIFSGC